MTAQEITASSAPQRSPARIPVAAVWIILAVAVAATNAWILVGGGGPLPWVGAIAGFLLALGLPAWMLSQKVDWRTDRPTERLSYSVVAAILGLLVIGLVINTVLPHIGIHHPLDRGPVLLAIDAWCGGLALWRRERFRPAIPSVPLDRLSSADLTIGSLAALCVPIAVVGANRLNNGASGTVTLAMLVLAGITFTLMFAKRAQLNPGTLPVAIYFIGLAMLLMTSLRGWYITGHDIQEEYRVFELTKTHGDWNISLERDGYNACLSITILPTMLWQVIRVDDPYIYKFWFQVLFALCPVLVYCITERLTGRTEGILAAMFFVVFPTYFTDMPFLDRQEIAFLFVAICIMIATNADLTKREIHVRLGIFSIGVVLSHYSTTYVFFATLAAGWAGYKAWTLFRRRRDKESVGKHAANRHSSWTSSINLTPAISLANVALVLLAILLWNGVATHTASGVRSTVSTIVDSLRGGSPDTSGGLSSGLLAPAPSQAQVAAAYRKFTLSETAGGRAAGVYYPLAVINKYPEKIIDSSELTPVTPIGRVFDDAGLNVSTLNSITRSGVARLLQLFVVLGLLASIRAKRRPSRAFVELLALSLGALAVVALQVVVPAISVDYGVLRAFLQAMIVFGPFIAIGSLVIFRPLGEKWGPRLAYAVALVFFLSLTGVIPQLLGGYPAQLNLNNSGQYYDDYYLHPQEISAIQWVQGNVPASSLEDVQSEVETDRYVFTPLTTFSPVVQANDIYPTMLRESSYVFLGYNNVVSGEATYSYDGDFVVYQYPVGLLQATDNLLYCSNGARLYQ